MQDSIMLDQLTLLMASAMRRVTQQKTKKRKGTGNGKRNNTRTSD